METWVTTQIASQNRTNVGSTEHFHCSLDQHWLLLLAQHTFADQPYVGPLKKLTKCWPIVNNGSTLGQCLAHVYQNIKPILGQHVPTLSLTFCQQNSFIGPTLVVAMLAKHTFDHRSYITNICLTLGQCLALYVKQWDTIGSTIIN